MIALTRTQKIAVASVAVVTAFGVGRFTTPVKTVTVTKTVEVEKKTVDTDVDLKKHRKTTKTVTTKPDGTKEEKTVTEVDSDNQKDQKIVDNKDTTTDSKTEVTKGSDSLTTLGILIGVDARTGQPVYGGSVYRPVLGPIGIGLNCLTNATCSATIGISL